MVEIVADKFEDRVIRIKGLAPDKVHPTSTEYKRLAKETK
jgi:lysophospholipase L1-like esterase